MKFIVSAALCLCLMSHSYAGAQTEAENAASEAVVETDEQMAKDSAVDTAAEAMPTEEVPTETEEVEADAVEPEEDYLAGYDFSEALVSHVLTELATNNVELLIDALESDNERRATLLFHRMDPMRVTHSGYDAFELTDSEDDYTVLRSINDNWQSLEASSKAIDGEPIEGIVSRTLRNLSNYLDQTYLPRLEALQSAGDLALSGDAALELYMNFLGVQSMLSYDFDDLYTAMQLFDGLPQELTFSEKIRTTRGKIEPMRRLAVEVRKQTLTEEKQATYKEQLAVFADDIAEFSTFMRSLASDG